MRESGFNVSKGNKIRGSAMCLFEQRPRILDKLLKAKVLTFFGKKLVLAFFALSSLGAICSDPFERAELGKTEYSDARIEYASHSPLIMKNVGQLDDSVLYYSDTNCGRVCVRRRDIVIQVLDPLHDDRCQAKQKVENVFISFPDLDFYRLIEGERACTTTSMIRGADGRSFNIPTFESLRIKSVRKGMDLVLGGERDSIWHYADEQLDEEGASQADPVIVIDTPNGCVLDSKEAVLSFPFGEYHLSLPGSRTPLDGIPVREDPEEPRQHLIWGTFIGGANDDNGAVLDIYTDGDVLVAGDTQSYEMPVPGGYEQTYNGNSYDIYLARVSRFGNELSWGTYLCGVGVDTCADVELDHAGNPIVLVKTNSVDLPVIGGVDPAYNGGDYDYYVAKLSQNGDSLSWGTYLGGSGADIPSSFCLDSVDNIYVTGSTDSDDIPVPYGYDQEHYEATDIYVAKLAADGGSLAWGTYIGGSLEDSASGVAMDSVGNVVVAGWTKSTDIQVPGGFDREIGGTESDIYIAKLSGDGSALLSGTYIGGKGRDAAKSVMVDPSDNVVIACTTSTSYGLPVPNGYDPGFNRGTYDIYAAKLAPTLDSVIWGTYIGGGGEDEAAAACMDADGNLIIGASTKSFDIPVPGGYLQSNPCTYGSTIYVARLSAGGDELDWGTFLYGSWKHQVNSLVACPDGNVVLLGKAESKSMPVTEDSYDPDYSGGGEFYLAKLSGSPSCSSMTLIPASLPDGIAGSNYDQALTVEGGTAPYFYEICSGELFTGMELSSDGVISGTSWETGARSFRVSVSDANNCQSRFACTLRIETGPLSVSPEVSPLSGGAPLSVNFTSRIAGGVRPYIVSWDFGDGTSGSGENVGHVYSSAGTFVYRVEVTDAEGSQATSDGVITVIDPPVITSVHKGSNPFRLIVGGSNFHSQVKALIGGAEWQNVAVKSGSKVILGGGNSLKSLFPKGEGVKVKIINLDDGGESNEYIFTR